MKTPKTIWLLSAYRADSHAAWADWLSTYFSQFHWHKIELSGRHFRWRIRGNPLSWLHSLPTTTPDLILATSMVDLATLKGLHPRLAWVPSLYYFHENQFAYPMSKHQLESIEPKMVQLYGALAANQCLFNSQFNLDSFLAGVGALLKKLPDEVPPQIEAQIKEKSRVLPIVIHPIQGEVHKNKQWTVWNHRWEYDKAPDVFYQALCQLKQRNIDFKLVLLGARHQQKNSILKQIEITFSEYIICNAKVSKTEYQRLLSQAGLVVSSAIHEFQGLSVLEAVSAGAVPVVPDALCYQEQYPALYRYTAGDSHALADKLAHFLTTCPPVPNVASWSNQALISRWEKTLLAL